MIMRQSPCLQALCHRCNWRREEKNLQYDISDCFLPPVLTLDMILPGVSHYPLQKEVYKEGREQATLSNTNRCFNFFFFFSLFFCHFKEDCTV